ncbi:hypothetical protein K435DRAFT_857830 [Dendrothele bispora CBS 962.96]|uniref:Uncharacterized protein n=1 Tax=Dendrothele bispora (strain CBS 962.96) TaxID=1314807 RepID=A0A4S8M580_DENBC|nr:hypothetical protein K435DRAFT_857830 [Dendrothele bispora CBS 962.96]
MSHLTSTPLGGAVGKANHLFYHRPGATLTTYTPATTKTSTTAILQPNQCAPLPTPWTAFATRNKAETLTPKLRYTYEEGETGIVTGGVMLGSPQYDGDYHSSQQRF